MMMLWQILLGFLNVIWVNKYIKLFEYMLIQENSFDINKTFYKFLNVLKFTVSLYFAHQKLLTVSTECVQVIDILSVS